MNEGTSKILNTLHKWLDEICHNADTIQYVQELGKGDDNVVLAIYTRTFQYELNVHPIQNPEKGKGLWLFCVARQRKAIAGNERPHEFGLFSGPFEKKSWEEIKLKMLRFELVKIAKQARRLDDIS